MARGVTLGATTAPSNPHHALLAAPVLLRCNFATARRSPASRGAVAFSTYQPVIAIVLWPSNSPVALLSHIPAEMFFQIRAESFGPLVERVFHCVGDDGCGADNAGRGSRCSHVLGHSKACLVGLSQSQQLCPLLGAKRTSISGDWRSACSPTPRRADRAASPQPSPDRRAPLW